MIIASASQFHVYLLKCESASSLVEAFSVIVKSSQTLVWPSFQALVGNPRDTESHDIKDQAPAPDYEKN